MHSATRFALFGGTLAAVVAFGSNRVLAGCLIGGLLLFEVALRPQGHVVVGAAIDGGAASGVALLAGPAGAPLLVLTALETRSWVPRWAPAAALAPAALVTALELAGAPHSHPALVAAAIAVPVAVVVERVQPMFRIVAANVQESGAREIQTRLATADRRVTSDAHDNLSSLVRILEKLRALALRSEDGDHRLSQAIDDAVIACQATRRAKTKSTFPDDVDPADESSSWIVDRWARIEKTPAWWPMSLRETWAASVGAWLDSIRHLHTREIERTALVGTLCIRAALLLTAPALGFLTLVGVVPLAPGVSTPRNAVWALAAAWALGIALVAPAVVARTVDSAGSGVRHMLLVIESAIGLGALLAVPSWLAFAFLSGPVNWLMRPDWHLRRLVAFVAAAAAALLLGLGLAGHLGSPWRVAGEVCISILCLAVVSDSFGLMFPVVVAHALFVLPARSLRTDRFVGEVWRERTDPLFLRLDDAISVAGEQRDSMPAAAEVEAELIRSKAHLESLTTATEPRPRPLRRRTLDRVVCSGLERAEDDPAHPLRCAAPGFHPPELGARLLRSWRDANHLEIVLGRIAAEAVRHGEFELRCSLALAADGEEVVVVVENDVPAQTPPTPPPESKGTHEIASAIAQLPGGAPLARGRVVGDAGVTVFSISFSFSSSALATAE